ncbi:hypothetical protein B0H19DRAFT_661060 [Mycena capillaripes]|nr:hypothetical protein B0H19DRAFT_661060 [Mycena capillaripes]
MVPLGEIDLYHEICLDNDTGVVGRAHESRRVRRVYSANVEGQSMTVAMYQGPGAEKEWRVEIRTYMSIRHPNIVQIRGAASSGGIHATLFHDDLIPFEHFLDLHRCSHFSTLYIYIYCGMDFRAATDYVYFIFQEKLNEEDCTLWIRRSTGRLCVELTESLYTHFYFCDVVGQTSTQGLSSWNALNAEDIIIQSLTIKHYHAIHFYQQRHFRPITISTPSAVRLAAILSCPPRNWVENHVEVAFLPNLKLDYGGGWTTLRGAPGERTEEGWTRFNSRDIFDSTLHLRCCVQISDRLRCWFSQANHIFSRLQVTSKFEDYYLVDMIDFEVKILSTTEGPPWAIYFSARKRTCKLVYSLWTGQHIGLSIHRVLSVLTRLRQLSLDSPFCNSMPKSREDRGTPMSTPEFTNSTRPRVLIQRARKLPEIWESHFINCAARSMIIRSTIWRKMIFVQMKIIRTH